MTLLDIIYGVAIGLTITAWVAGLVLCLVAMGLLKEGKHGKDEDQTTEP